MAKKQETRGTIQHFIRYRWKDINKRTINGTQSKRVFRINNASYLRKGIEVRMTRDEFKRFCLENERHIMALYASGDTPSIDRIDPNGHYEIGNIRILSLSQNRGRRY